MPPVRDPRIDAYIEKAQPFAQPILRHLRALVHETCPDVTETVRWGMPHFDHGGQMMASMASFKAHAVFGFWKGKLIVESSDDTLASAMGQYGRITALSDLPPKAVMAGHIRRAMELNEAGVKAPRQRKFVRPAEVAVPDDLAAALRRNRAARETFEAFPPSHRREYVSWIVEAKRDETRRARLAQAIEWLAEGKSRMWKYERPRAATTKAAAPARKAEAKGPAKGPAKGAKRTTARTTAKKVAKKAAPRKAAPARKKTAKATR